MEFIIHADDFGISSQVNSCIDYCFSNKLISEASIMVNMPAFSHAWTLAKNGGYNDRIGLHLNLTAGVPLTEEIREIPLFCNEDGVFNKRFHVSKSGRFLLGSKAERAVRTEIKAQLECFSQLGGAMMQMDSHHHTHTDISIYPIIKELAREYGIRRMRISANVHRVGWMKQIYKYYVNSMIRRDFKTYDCFDGLNSSLYNMDFGQRKVEVMVHPVWADEGIIFDRDEPYAVKLRALMKMSNSSIRGIM